MANILVLDDAESVRKTLRKALEDASHSVVTAENGGIGLELMTATRFDLVVIDVFMPERDGVETVRLLRSRGDTTPVLAISGATPGHGGDLLEAMLALGANRTMAKPFRMSDFVQVVGEMLQRGSTS